jgi:hypothetical protein
MKKAPKVTVYAAFGVFLFLQYDDLSATQHKITQKNRKTVVKSVVKIVCNPKENPEA